MTKKIWIYILAIIVGLLTALILGSYILNFGKYNLSDDPNDWGTFGDYVGGLLNPLLSIVNILITYYIARIVSKFSEKESDKQEQAQLRVIKSQMRFEAWKDFKSEIDKLFAKINDSIIEQNHDLIKYFVSETVKSIESFKDNYVHLFDNNHNYHVPLVNELNSIVNQINNNRMVQSIPGHKEPLNLTKTFESVSRTKNSMFSSLSGQIIIKLEGKNRTVGT